MPPIWRISLNHIDGPYLREAIQTRGAALRKDVEPNDSESQRRMTRNLDNFIRTVKNMSPEAQRELADTIRNRVLLVKVVVEDWDGGYNVFRVLNTRGKANRKKREISSPETSPKCRRSVTLICALSPWVGKRSR